MMTAFHISFKLRHLSDPDAARPGSPSLPAEVFPSAAPSMEKTEQLLTKKALSDINIEIKKAPALRPEIQGVFRRATWPGEAKYIHY